MKKFFLSALAITSLVACSKDELVNQQGPVAISFKQAYVENVTRATDPSTTTDNIASFDVWGFMDQPSGTIFEGQDVTKSGNEWTYSPLQYWTPGHTYYFGALSPMNSANWDLDTTGASTDGVGVVSFTNVDGTEDLIYAATSVTTSNDINNQPESVKLAFNHLLSKVKFSFTNGFPAENYTINVKNIKMTVPAAGSIDLAVENWWDNDDWTLENGTTTLEFGNMETENLAISKIASSEKELLTIPAGDEQEYTVTFDVELYAGDVLAFSNSLATNISGAALEMGKAYNFHADLNVNNVAESALTPIVFEVEMVKDWENGNGYDGGQIDTEVVEVATASDLVTLAAGISDGTIASDVKIVLDGDIDLAELNARAITTNWSPIGNGDFPFEGVFDGRGYTIKNFNYVADEPVYFVGFFGCVQNATIKNLVMENIYLEFASETAGVGGTIGGVVGGLYGNCVLENITVKGDVKIVGEIDKKGAGRIGAVVGGNQGSAHNTIIKNVHVEANDGSFVQGNNAIGGIAGALYGIVTYENCSSNIDVTAGQYFAGGIIGLASTYTTLTNCSTSGDISVVAGRAGNANDLYRVGGLVGTWDDDPAAVLTLTNCSYTGAISGQDANGTVATTFDCEGYVGRGYSTDVGAKVSVNGVVYTYEGNGVYSTNN